MKKILFIFFISFCVFSYSQKNNFLTAHEDTLVFLLNSTRNEKDISKAFEKNVKFEKHLLKLLIDNDVFSYEFDSLSTMMSTITSPDNSFRIFNWNIELPKQEHIYHCVILRYDKKSEDYSVIKLFDKSASAFDPEYLSYSDKTWFGALYYEIIPIQKQNTTIYTLLGWDGNNQFSNKKIIESMEFQKKDAVKFGHPIFSSDDFRTKRRVIFQYNKNSYMSLKYRKIKKQQLIIFDHLSPKSPNLEGMKDWYVTDLSFDAFLLENKKWIYVKDFDAQQTSVSKRPFNNP